VTVRLDRELFSLLAHLFFFSPLFLLLLDLHEGELRYAFAVNIFVDGTDGINRPEQFVINVHVDLLLLLFLLAVVAGVVFRQYVPEVIVNGTSADLGLRLGVWLLLELVLVVEDVDLVDADVFLAFGLVGKNLYPVFLTTLHLSLLPKSLLPYSNDPFSLTAHFLDNLINQNIAKANLQNFSLLLIEGVFRCLLLLAHVVVVCELEVELRLLEVSPVETALPDHSPHRPQGEEHTENVSSHKEGVGSGSLLRSSQLGIPDEVEVDGLEKDQEKQGQYCEDEVDHVQLRTHLQVVDQE
jgi:hypothetical protein